VSGGGQGRYRAGAWYVIFTPDAVVMVDDGMPARDVQRLWEVVHGGADLEAILAELDRPAARRVFGVAVTGPDGLQTRVRPGVALLVDRGDGGPPLVDTGDGHPDGALPAHAAPGAPGNPGAPDGAAVAPPHLVRLIRVGATDHGADVTLPVVCGVVRADDVEWTPARGTRRVRGRRAVERAGGRPGTRPSDRPVETRPVSVTPGLGRAGRPDDAGAYRDEPGPAPDDAEPGARGRARTPSAWGDRLDETFLPQWTSERWRQHGRGGSRPDDPADPAAGEPDDVGDAAAATGNDVDGGGGGPDVEGATGVYSQATPPTWRALAARAPRPASNPATPSPGTPASPSTPTLQVPADETRAPLDAEPPPSDEPADRDGPAARATPADRDGPADLDPPAERGGGAPTVHAVLCSAQHPNPVQATYCRSCGEALGFASVQLVSRPPLGVLRFSTGQEVVLDQNVLVGRAPRADRVPGRQLPRPVRIEGQGLDISRNHLEVRLEGWHVLVVDLGSRNGTLVTLPGRAPQLIDARVPCLIAVGTVVELTEDVTFSLESLP